MSLQNGLGAQVIIKLSRAKTDAPNTIEQCAYWHETKKVWSTDGCLVGPGSGDELECHCTHLTLFAGLLLTLMSRKQLGAKRRSLEF